jgi:GNAT superfamily N-acetyltransferase
VRLAALKDAPYAFGTKYEWEITKHEESWRTRLAARMQLVAEVDGKVVGTAGGIASDDGNAALISMWVAPSARGKGAGEQLVNTVVDWARQEGYPGIRLWVTDGNDAAEKLYVRCGFRRTGGTKRVFPSEPRMEFEMERDL